MGLARPTCSSMQPSSPVRGRPFGPVHTYPMDQPDLPADADLVAALAATPADLRSVCVAAIGVLENALAEGRQLVEWIPPEQVDKNTWTEGWASYDDDVLWNALQAARTVIAETNLGSFWVAELPDSVAVVDAGSLAETAAFLNTIHHRERIVEGLLATCLDRGLLLAALLRLRSAFPAAGH